MLLTYCRTSTSDLLITLLSDSIRQIMVMGHLFETLPALASHSAQLTEQDESDQVTNKMIILREMTEHIVKTIVSSAPRWPLPVRFLCKHLLEAFMEEFPEKSQREAVRITLGGMIFLRLICPLIINPSKLSVYTLIDTVSASAQKGLTLVAKVLQNAGFIC